MTRIDPAELARLIEQLGTLAPEPDVPGDVSVALRDASTAITALVADLAQVTAARDQHFSQALENGRRALDAEARLREIEQYAAPSMEPFKDWETEGVNRGKRLLHIHALTQPKP